MSFAEKMKRKWQRNTERSVDNYRDGIAAVTVNPMKKAAENYEKWKDKLMRFIESGVWKEIMANIPADVWKKITTEVGPGHFTDGVRTKAFKYMNFADAWGGVYGPKLEELRRKIPAITDADRERRMIENRKLLISLKGKWRRAATGAIRTE